MREAALILPLADNDGAPVASAHLYLQAALLGAFGGYTTTAVTGAWRDEATGLTYRDTSTEYRVAGAWEGDALARLQSIAARAAADAGQVCVYVRGPDGAVTFVPAAEGETFATADLAAWEPVAA